MSKITPSPAAQAAELTLTDQELLLRLGWFVHIRWVVGAMCLALLLIGNKLLGVRLSVDGQEVPLARPVHVVVGLLGYNAVFAYLGARLRRSGRVTRQRIVRLALGQIAFDLVGVCVLIHNTGGVENFFIVLTVVPLVLASALLPRALAYGVAAGAAVLIHALAWSEQTGLLAHVHVDWPGRGSPAQVDVHADPLYVLQVTGALTVLFFGTVFLASTIASQLRRREEDLEQAYRQIRLADEAKGFFMRKAGHELRSPLVAIGTIIKAILQTVTTLGDEHRRLIDRAWQRTHSATAVLDDLRRYANLHSLQGLLSPQTVQFGQLVQAMTDLLRPQAEKAGLRVSCLIDDVAVKGDHELLRELVSNLLTNAIQYTPAGGRIELAVRRIGSTVQLQVSDTGIGISEEARSRLFDEFYRAEEAKKVFPEGTGLGLAICKRIAYMHGGKIAAASRPEGGSVFTVELPAYDLSASIAQDTPGQPARGR
jgi:signal transduction histidine kinase